MALQCQARPKKYHVNVQLLYDVNLVPTLITVVTTEYKMNNSKQNK